MNQPELPIDDIDRDILNQIQSNFPITSRPYHRIAKELGLTEKAENLTKKMRIEN